MTSLCTRSHLYKCWRKIPAKLFLPGIIAQKLSTLRYLYSYVTFLFIVIKIPSVYFFGNFEFEMNKLIFSSHCNPTSENVHFVWHAKLKRNSREQTFFVGRKTYKSNDILTGFFLLLLFLYIWCLFVRTNLDGIYIRSYDTLNNKWKRKKDFLRQIYWSL